jgi:hypothetical protein
MKSLTLALLAAALSFTAVAQVPSPAPRVMVQYASQRAVGMDQFGPAFVPYIFVLAFAGDSSVDGFVFTVTFSTPTEPTIVKTKVLTGVVSEYGTAAVCLPGEAVPSSIKVTVHAFSTRKDIPEGEALAQ